MSFCLRFALPSCREGSAAAEISSGCAAVFCPRADKISAVNFFLQGKKYDRLTFTLWRRRWVAKTVKQTKPSTELKGVFGIMEKENAVIYPRLSSYGQNEQSIEGQVRICREFAESRGLNVVNVYPEKARTGTNDDRPAFQRMIKDAESGAYRYIIVYMFDRFARNRRDSIMYKEMLKDKYGIKVISATQPITEDEGGEFYEMFLEWNDEKYSKRLS